MRIQSTILAALMISSCSATTESRRSTSSAANGGEANAAGEEVGFTTDIQAEQSTQLAQAVDPKIDYKIKINCVYGSAKTPVDREYTKSAVDAGSATLPKLAQNCVAYLSSLSVTPSGSSAALVFAPPAVIDPSKPMVYTAASATSNVKTVKAFPSPLDAVAANNKVSFSFNVLAAGQSAKTDLEIIASQISSSAVVAGTTPPLYSILNSGDVALSGSSCIIQAVAECASGAVLSADGKSLVSCAGVAVASTKISVDGVVQAASAVTQSSKVAKDLIFPVKINNCDPGASGVVAQTFSVVFVNDSGDGAANSTLTVPLAISIKFKPQ